MTVQAEVREHGPYRAWAVTGARGEVETWLRSVARRGDLVRAGAPFLVRPGVWAVRAVVLPRVPRSELPAPPVPPAWVPPVWLTGRVVARTVAGLAVLAALAGLLWVLWQAVTGAAQWTAGHAGQVVAVLALAVLAGAAWAVRRLRRGTPACTTTTVHGRRCRGH